MSYLAQRVVLEPRARLQVGAADVPAVAGTAVLVLAAGWLARRWWSEAAIVPMSWQPPTAEALFLVPGAVVVGLLALRLVIGGRQRSVAVQHLLSMAARWAGLWAGLTLVWLVWTTVELYGGLGGLAGADNVALVLGADPAATSRLTLLWVALLVALFGPRLSGWRESLGLTLLGGVALLAAVPFTSSGSHGHGAAALSPALPAVAALQALALAVWLGALLAVPHLQTPLYRLRHHLLRFGDLVSVAALVVGVTAVVAGLMYPGRATPPALAVAELAAVGLVNVVGHRHRRRVVDVVAVRRGPALLALAGGEVIIMAAVVLLSAWVPVGG